MQMHVKSALIRKYRTDKLWSQEQLAQASGLGLRTIQRLEAQGQASIESVKSLAAVFNVDADSLIWPDGGYQPYLHKQWGVVTLAVFGLGILFLLVTNYEAQALPPVFFFLTLSFLVIPCVLFSSMTVEVNEREVSWFFGPGVLKKSLLLDEIGSCKKVNNPIWMGFGIHAFGTGWIYNVSGLLGVEIELKSGSFVRLGTDEPNYLVQAIHDALDHRDMSQP